MPETHLEMKTWDDATWILTSTFIIFTMQSGFGLLESGSVSTKNEGHIMVKNSADVIFGTLSYWTIGYGLSFGENSFYGLFATDGFFVDSDKSDQLGHKFAHFFFQSSFATTATTIVSGSMAERASFVGYTIFSFFNTFVYALPAHWIWHPDGFLNKNWGAIDYAGSGAVHLVGGCTGLVASLLLGPRTGRFQHPSRYRMDNPVNAILGLFILWWGWLGFNCGSTYGVAGAKWKLAAKAAVITLNGSIGGGAVALIWSMIQLKGKVDISYVCNGILGGLVAITSICTAISPLEAFIMGGLATPVVVGVSELLPLFGIDDPVGAVAVHGGAGLWSIIAVGFFATIDETEEQLVVKNGLLHGGDSSLLIAQCVYACCCIAWSSFATVIIMTAIHKTIGLRCELVAEIFGADLMEHNIGGSFDHHTREIFTKTGERIGVVEEGMAEDKIWDLYNKFLLVTDQELRTDSEAEEDKEHEIEEASTTRETPISDHVIQ